MATGSISTLTLNSSTQVGQYFVPSLPADATSWKPTTLGFKARCSSGTFPTTAQVDVYIANASKLPSATKIATEYVSIPGSNSAPANDWFTTPINVSTSIAPGQGICVVIRRAPLGFLNFDVTLSSDPGAANGVYSANGGTAWTLYPSTSMIHQIQGEYEVPGTTSTIYHLRSITTQIRTQVDPDHTLRTTIDTLNRPTVTP